MLSSPSAASSRALLAGAGGVFVLLAALATLQYHWLGQVGEADQVRLRQAAQGRADELARDFDREVTRAFLRLQIDAEAARARDARLLLERRERYEATTAYPGLVREVWLADVNGDGLWRAEASGAFVPAPWPVSLASVREAIRERSRSPAGPAGEPRPGPPPSPRPERRGFDPVDDVAFALVLPIVERAREAPAREAEPRPGPPFNVALRPVGYTVIALDPDFIRDQFLPALTRRHFGLDAAAEYAVLVTARHDPGTVVFRSSPRGAAPGPGDAAVHFFGLRLEDANPEDFVAFPMARPAPPRERAVPRGTEELRRPGGRRGGPEGRWRLVATHRMGSLDRVVAAARLRNLAVGGVILALLAASVVLVVVSAQRARRLADRQLEFVAGVSHELRTPVAVIASAGENLADGLVGEATMVRQYGRMVRDEARRLAEMVEQVLDFAGSYSGRRAYRFEALEAGALARECAEAVAPLVNEAGGLMEVEVAPGLPPVSADPPALRRAVVNLLENAVKYGGDAPRIRLRVAPAAARRSEVEISVQDRGLGIPPAEQARLFEPFFRGEEARARPIRGSGLGLSLVKRIVAAHGGRVGVASAPGRGSTFTITLPAAGGLRAPAALGTPGTHERPHTAG